MKKISVDQTLCNGYGHCVIEAPDHFDLNDDSGKATLLKEDIADGDRAKVESAAMLCPVQAISVSE
ncbi:ferredoxin [Streptomyces sp. 6N223]|uniref:ferredoxin n=1 Tax=Streptomyces sp. 6N223 TaxID=3457412 RepID=UPI003FD2682D